MCASGCIWKEGINSNPLLDILHCICMLSCKYYFRNPTYFILHLDVNIGAKAALNTREWRQICIKVQFFWKESSAGNVISTLLLLIWERKWSLHNLSSVGCVRRDTSCQVLGFWFMSFPEALPECSFSLYLSVKSLPFV